LMFRRDLERAMKDDHGYFLGMGDLSDVASPSNRARLRAADTYDSVNAALDEIGAMHAEKIKRLLKGTEGRWLGFLEGHHLWEFADGTTTDMRVAQAMNAPFLGSCAFVRLRFVGFGKNNRRTCTIWFHHGAGGGIKASAPLNKLENVIQAFDADVYLIGHAHKKVSAIMNQIFMTRKAPYKLGHRTQIIACTGGYLRSYMPGSKVGTILRGGYAERGMMTPTELGGVQIHVTPVREGLDLKVTL